MEFDTAAAKAAGYTPAEIAEFQQQIESARAAGYSDEEIQQYLASAHGAPPAAPSDPALLAQSVAQGAASALGLPGSIAAGTQAAIARSPYSARNLAAHGYPGLIPNPLSWLPTSEQLENDLLSTEHSLGITPPGPPVGSSQRLLAAAGQGVGGMLPFALGGAPADLLSALSAGAASGVGGQLGHSIAPGTAADPWLTGAGSLLGLPVGTALAGLPARGVNLLLGDRTPMGELFDSTGLPLRSAAYTTGVPATQRKLGQYAPLELTQQDIGNAIDAHASALGGSRTYTEAGTQAQAAARDWLDNQMPAREAALWSGVDRLLPDQTPVPLSNFREVLGKLAGKGGKLNSLVQALPGESMSAGLKAKLDSLDSLLREQFSWVGKPAVSEYPRTPGAMPDVVPNWRDARALRTAIGNVMGAPSVVSSGVAKQLEPLYAGLTQDLQEAASRVSPEARAAFDSANVESTKLHSFTKDVISKLLKHDNPEQAGITPEQAASNILRGGTKGGTMLARLREYLPNAANELSAAEIRNRGLESEPDLGNLPGSPAHKSFSSRWGSLSPEMKQALIPDASARAQMDDLSTLAKNVTNISRARPTLADRLGETVAGGLGGLLTGTLFAHGNPYAELVGSALGASGGFGVGSLFGSTRSAIANSPLLATLASARAPLAARQLLVAPALSSNALLNGGQ